MESTIGDVGEDFVCLYLDGDNDSDKAFLELLVTPSKFTRYEMIRNSADSYTLCITKPPQRQRKVAKRSHNSRKPKLAKLAVEG